MSINQFETTPIQHFTDDNNDPTFSRKEKILEDDKRKRRLLFFVTGFIITFSLIAFFAFSFKASIYKNTAMVDHFDLLSSSEELEFYENMGFYKWLEKDSEIINAISAPGAVK